VTPRLTFRVGREMARSGLSSIRLSLSEQSSSSTEVL